MAIKISIPSPRAFNVFMSLKPCRRHLNGLGATLLFITLTVVSPIASSVNSCSEIFQSVTDFSSSPRPKAIQYCSIEGIPRLFTDKGEILQILDRKWTPIGQGKMNKGVILEQLLPQYRDRIDPVTKRPIYKPPRLGRIKGITGFIEIKTAERDHYYWNSALSRRSVITTLSIRGHQIEIIVPKGSSEKYMEGIKAMVLQLPLGRINVLKRLTLNPEPYRNNAIFRGIKEYADYGYVDAAMAAGDGEISIFNSQMLKNVLAGDLDATAILFHEFGHLLSEELFGSITPSQDYIDFVKDENAMTDYAATNWSEDFAESFMEYLRSNGDPNSTGLRKTHRKRFGYFDRVFRYRVAQATP